MKLLKELKSIADLNLPQLKDNNGELSVLKPIDSGAIELLRDINNSALSYNPMHIEPLMDEITKHLDRCLDLQSIAQGIEREALMDILNYDRIQKELELSQKSLENIKVYEGNTKALSKQISLENNEGTISGNEDSIGKISAFETNRLEIEQKLINNKKTINAKINELRNLRGSSFNLSERYGNAKEIFEIEFKELFAKLKSVEKGLKSVYKINNFELPEITESGYLVKLFKYVKLVTNKLENLFQYEQEFLISIPLRYGYYKNNKHYKIYENDAKFKDQVAAGSLNFELPDEIFEELSNVRLRAIKMSVRWDNAVNTSDRWNFIIELPRQRDENGNILWEIPNYNSVGLMANNPGYIYSNSRDLSIYNASLKGEWTIKLPTHSSRQTDINHGDMNDIWFEILVSARNLKK